MNNKTTALALGAFLFALSFSAHAQQPGKMFRIGFLDTSTASGSAVLLDAFRQEMRKLGWIEGKNIAIDYRFAEQKPERLAELAADLVRLKVDLMVVSGTPETSQRDYDAQQSLLFFPKKAHRSSLPANPAYRLFTHRRNLWKLAVSCLWGGPH